MRIYNFSAGPSTLPIEVLEKVKADFLDYEGCGMSVTEISHRGKIFEKINSEAKRNLRKLMNIPDNYDIIFVQGGAAMQFEAVPLNLSRGEKPKGDYIVSGSFSSRAYNEALKYGDMKLVASSEDKNYTYIPEVKRSDFRKDADYVHICYNNTAFGTRYVASPDTGDVPLVADLSSCILSQEFDVSKFGVIYAGAQKNIGPAGTTIIIIRKDLEHLALPICPTMLKWSTMTESDNLFNTPPVFAIYMAGEVFKYLLAKGGVKPVNEKNEKKAAMLYDYLDKSDFYNNPVQKPYRSIMNVIFTTPSPALDDKFAAEAEKAGLFYLKGHKVAGGIRASIYNAMPLEGVEKLLDFMYSFEKQNA